MVSKKVVAKEGEYVIDTQAINVPNEQTCMDLCALES